jgi:hypothetical protein
MVTERRRWSATTDYEGPHMRIRGILTTAVTASVTAIALGTTPAFAAVTFNSTTGKGFVGKGDVQTALGYNNATLQKAVDSKSLVFTATQPTFQQLSQDATQAGSQAGSQAGTQEGTQAGTQSGTQAVTQTLTCDFTNGSGTKTFHRSGVRDAERTGTRSGSREGTRTGSRDATRDGSRTGSRAGTLTGSLNYTLDVDARKSNQYTGFVLNGWKAAPSYEAGTTTWDAPQFGGWTFGTWSFGDWTFSGDYTFADYTFGDYTFASPDSTQWGDWDAAPGENPDDCLRSATADKITLLENVITPGAVTDGPIVDGAVTDGVITPGDTTGGAITEGEITYTAVTAGAVTPSGPAKLFVNGKAL